MLGGVLSGEVVAAWAFAEHGDRWDASGVRATAEIDGDESVLSGTKRYVEAAMVRTSSSWWRAPATA